MINGNQPEDPKGGIIIIDDNIQKLFIEKSLQLEAMLKSDDPDQILKARQYLESSNSKGKSELKSYIFAPEAELYSGLGFKDTLKSTSYEICRMMAKVPVIQAIISTRKEQVHNFINFTLDPQEEGWTIQKKRSIFDKEEEQKLSSGDKKKIEYIKNFIESGGEVGKWDITDDFEQFIPKFIDDSLTINQSCFEVERNRGNRPVTYSQIDGSTIRLLETVDPNFINDKNNIKYEELKGYLPYYCQVWHNQVVTNPKTKEQVLYYPWELCFAVRNRSSSIYSNGYGTSELEILIQVITYILYGLQYNGNFFKQGSNPKGFFWIKGNVDQKSMNDFRMAWRQMVSGVWNAHKVPIFEGSDEIKWNDMQHSNKDMEFKEWNEFLTILACAVFRIDPDEIGFHLKGQGMFGQEGQKERIQHSREKGMKPLLRFAERNLNKYIVSEIDDKFEFKWTGVNQEDQDAILEADVKKAASGFISLEDGFKKWTGRDFDPEKDTILNPVYLQMKQMDQYGGEESNDAVNQMAGGEGEGADNPFNEFEQSEDNPIMDLLYKYVEDNLKN